MNPRIHMRDLDPDQKRALQTLIDYAKDDAEFLDRLSKRRETVADYFHRERRSTAPEKERYWREWLDIVGIGAQTGRIQEPLLFLLRVHAAEQVHEERQLDGAYRDAFADVDRKMDEVARTHDLGPEEYWPIGEGPPEWEQLNGEWNAISDHLLTKTLAELDLTEEAALHRDDRQEFERRRSLGIRVTQGEVGPIEQLEILQAQFEREAQDAASVGAFHAAAGMIGAAIESALLARCLAEPAAALAARSQLPKKHRPKAPDPNTWKLDQLARVADLAGWLPRFCAPEVEIPSSDLIEIARELRNMLHPARHIAKGLTSRVVRGKYEAARAGYLLLRRHLGR